MRHLQDLPKLLANTRVTGRLIFDLVDKVKETKKIADTRLSVGEGNLTASREKVGLHFV